LKRVTVSKIVLLTGSGKSSGHNVEEDRQMVKLIKRFQRDETGAAMVEYGLLVALIALVVAVGAGTLGTDINNLFVNIGKGLPAA
jgi:pilus assembly protein Flp/PilA